MLHIGIFIVLFFNNANKLNHDDVNYNGGDIYVVIMTVMIILPKIIFIVEKLYVLIKDK